MKLNGTTLYFMSVICILSMLPTLGSANELSAMQQSDPKTVLNKRMSEEAAELQQVAGYTVESFTDERGYTAIKITFDANSMSEDPTKVFSRTARTPMRNIASSLKGYSGTDVIIRVFDKSNKGLSKANALKSYFVQDGISAKRFQTEGFAPESATLNKIEITIRVSADMIRDAQSGTLE